MACLLNQYAVEIFQRLQFVYLSLFKWKLKHNCYGRRALPYYR
jgi:hypothetical protein